MQGTEVVHMLTLILQLVSGCTDVKVQQELLTDEDSIRPNEFSTPYNEYLKHGVI
jgi:hypothetical protein